MFCFFVLYNKSNVRGFGVINFFLLKFSDIIAQGKTNFLKSLFYASLLREMNNRRCYKKLFFPSHSVVLEPVFLPSQATIFTLSTLISSVTSLNSTSYNTKGLILLQNLCIFRQVKESHLVPPHLVNSLKVKVAQLCPALCNPMDRSLPGSSVHGILQARILEWVAIPFSEGSSRSRDQAQVSHIAGRFFTNWTIREAS